MSSQNSQTTRIAVDESWPNESLFGVIKEPAESTKIPTPKLIYDTASYIVSRNTVCIHYSLVPLRHTVAEDVESDSKRGEWAYWVRNADGSIKGHYTAYKIDGFDELAQEKARKLVQASDMGRYDWSLARVSYSPYSRPKPAPAVQLL
jgi:hypothetical protein